MVNGLLSAGNHLITRCKSNSVAYFPYQHRGPKKRGRPRVNGKKVALRTLFQSKSKSKFQSAPSPVYGETRICIDYRVRDLLWRPVGRIVRFVLVVHPTRGQCILMSTDTTLDALEIIRISSFGYNSRMTRTRPIVLPSKRRSGSPESASSWRSTIQSSSPSTHTTSTLRIRGYWHLS